MKKIFILAALIALMGTVNAQGTTQLSSPVGIGIAVANADLHIHESVYTDPAIGGQPRDTYPGDFITTLRLTNTATSTTAVDGFVIEQYNKQVTLRQHEKGNLRLFGYNDVGLTIDTLGRMALDTTPAAGKTLNVRGNTGIGGNLDVKNNVTAANGNFSGALAVANNITATGNVTAVNGNFSGTLSVAGNTSLGNGFRCTNDGQVTTKSIRVTLDGWSDFVFDDGYSMPSLPELEQYIRQHRHLPDIPSAQEVEEGGIDLGEMNAKLLQKVEELTLYVIDLQKQIEELKQHQK